MKKNEFAKLQPKHGDAILHCGHLDSKQCHFFHVEPPMSFARPNATVGKASWIIACDLCYQHSAGDCSKIKIRGDGTWKGDEPAVKKYNDG